MNFSDGISSLGQMPSTCSNHLGTGPSTSSIDLAPLGVISSIIHHVHFFHPFALYTVCMRVYVVSAY